MTMIRLPLGLSLLAATAFLGGCAVSIGDSDYSGGLNHAGRSRIEDGERRIMIEEAHDSRRLASDAMAQEIDRLRTSGCSIDFADGWRRVEERDGEDLRGFRIIAICPAI